jgi:polyferredoxin
MQLPPFTFWSISLWLAVTSIILLITAQLVSAYDGPATLLIDSRKLKTAALIIGILFLATVAIHIYTIITST